MRVDDPMAHTFSSISPKHGGASAQVEQKKFFLKVANTSTNAQNEPEDQSFINPFSIASRKDSD